MNKFILILSLLISFSSLAFAQEGKELQEVEKFQKDPPAPPHEELDTKMGIYTIGYTLPLGAPIDTTDSGMIYSIHEGIVARLKNERVVEISSFFYGRDYTFERMVKFRTIIHGKPTYSIKSKIYHWVDGEREFIIERVQGTTYLVTLK